MNTFRESRKKIMNSILDAVGNTPLVRCSRIANSMGIKCEIRTPLFVLAHLLFVLLSPDPFYFNSGQM